jgi:hypothetical protein
MSDILQRLVTGNLTSNEKRGVSDFNKKYDTDKPDPLEPIAVSFALQKNQKQAVFQDVKQRILDGKSPEEIASAVVAAMDEHLTEKEHEAYPAAYPDEKAFVNPKSGKKGGFKRV